MQRVSASVPPKLRLFDLLANEKQRDLERTDTQISLIARRMHGSIMGLKPGSALD